MIRHNIVYSLFTKKLPVKSLEAALPPCEVVRYFFNAGCRIYCGKQQIQVYFDITTRRFASLIKKFWPKFLELKLWNWNYYPGTA